MLLLNSNIRLFLVLLLLGTPLRASAQSGCSANDKGKPPLFISFVQPDDKSWDGEKSVKGALLKLTNNSNCRITFSAAPDEPQSGSSLLVFRNGKMVRRDNLPFGSLQNGQRISPYYLTKYPNQKYLLVGGLGGDVLETVYLNAGDYVLFGVPLKNFQRGGEILLPFTYDWDEGERGEIINKNNGYVEKFETVEHYLRFVAAQLPNGALK